MYRIFGQDGVDYPEQDAPVGHYYRFDLDAEGGQSDGLPFAWSDGKNLHLAATPPPDEYHVISNGVWVVADDASVRRLAVAKTAKTSVLNDVAQAFINDVSGADLVPDFELSTWPLQAAEAQAWAADKTAATPVLDRIAAARGMDADKLKAAALRKALAYSALSAHVAGQRQALQSKIEAAKTVAALDKIKIEFTAPPEAV